MEYQLTITFRGICTFFRNTVPGVPLRAVLPDATSWHPGVVTAPGMPSQTYMLPPHFAYVYSPDADAGINAPGIVLGGWIISGVRMQIVNAIDPCLEYADPALPELEGIPNVPSVRQFAHQYRYSDSVVLGGRALAYFDIFRGKVSSTVEGEAFHTVVTMRTNGLPRLQITALAAYNKQDDCGVRDVNVGSTLVVGNQALSGLDSQFDFLWHLTTDQAGIPQNMPQPPLGSDDGFGASFDLRTATNEVAQVLGSIQSGVPNISPAEASAFDTSASCSNSQYP